ncbi:MAG TPA: tetratricopeptide repeat protein, partial [Smithellaceae bacterium]|nr:tetratricopeptide repeat protein [Smithellaceae bacterium]
MFSIAICATCTTGDDLDDEVTAYKKGDYKTELKLLQKEADKGNAVAQFRLGVMYDDGKGVVQDYKEAFKWYKLAADQGFAGAQFGLGLMYANGRGVP